MYIPTNTCPNCGYCPHCGRGGFHTLPYQQPWPGFYHPPTWMNGQPVTNLGFSGNIQLGNAMGGSGIQFQQFQ